MSHASSPPKLLQIGSSMPDDFGGIERYLCHLSAALVGEGQTPLVTSVPSSPLAKNLPVPSLPHAFRHKYDLKGIGAMVQILRHHAPAAAFAHFSPDYVPSGISARIAKIPLIYVRHVAIPWSRGKARLYGRFAHGFIGVSDAVSSSLVASNLPAHRVRTCLSGISPLLPTLTREEARQKWGIEGFAIGTFGRLVPEKGHQTVFSALPRLPGVTYHVFGDGPSGPSLREAAKGLPVVFHGYTDQVANASLALDAVVIPSTWAEAFSISILETLSLGQVLVASQVGGIPEAVVDGESGLLIPPSEPEAMVGAISRLQNHPALREALAAGASNRYNENFRLEHFGRRFLTTTDSLLNEKTS